MSNQANLRTIVRGAYDIQKLRIQMGNRIVGNFKVKLGQEPSEKEDQIDALGKKILSDLRQSHKKLTDGVKRIPPGSKFKGEGVISNYTEFCLVSSYLDIETDEELHFKRLANILKDFPIYNEYLAGVKGVGPAMAGVIISEIDIHKARHPSSLCKYAGLDVGKDGAGRSRRKEHLVKVKYTDKDGKEAERNSITFNPFLKTKLLGVLATSFLRAGDNPYRTIYDGYKSRLEHHPSWAEKSKGHRHNAALRYMIKMFLIDLHLKWRVMEGYPPSTPYHQAKLGITHAA